MPTCCFYICHMEKSKQIHFLPCGVIRFNFGGFGIVLADFLGAYPFACCDCSIASCVWSKANFSKYARYSIFLPAASYDSAMCAYDSNFGWDSKYWFSFFHIQLFPFCNFSFEFLFNGVVFIQYWIKMIHPTEIMIRYAQKADIKSDFHITGQLM